MCFVSSLVWSFFICCTFGLRLSLKGRSLRWCHTWHGVGMWGISVRTPYIPLRPPAPLLKLLTACANTFFWTKTKKMEVWMNRKSGICSWEFPTVKHFPHPPIVAEAGTRHVLHSILELGSSLWGSGTTDTRAGRVRYGSLWIPPKKPWFLVLDLFKQWGISYYFDLFLDLLGMKKHLGLTGQGYAWNYEYGSQIWSPLESMIRYIEDDTC